MYVRELYYIHYNIRIQQNQNLPFMEVKYTNCDVKMEIEQVYSGYPYDTMTLPLYDRQIPL